MKRFLPLLIAALVALAIYAVVGLAQAPGQPAAAPAAAGPGPIGGPARLMARPVAMAVSGNSIYVVSGNLLLKYDSDLNLIKQVELPRVDTFVERLGQGPGAGTRRRGGGAGRGMRGGGAL